MCSAEIALAGASPTSRPRPSSPAWLATAWVASERLRDALGPDTDVPSILALHPAIPPGFARAVETDGNRVQYTLTAESSALMDPNQPGWIGALVRGEQRGLEGIVLPIDPKARVKQ